MSEITPNTAGVPTQPEPEKVLSANAAAADIPQIIAEAGNAEQPKTETQISAVPVQESLDVPSSGTLIAPVPITKDDTIVKTSRTDLSPEAGIAVNPKASVEVLKVGDDTRSVLLDATASVSLGDALKTSSLDIKKASTLDISSQDSKLQDTKSKSINEITPGELSQVKILTSEPSLPDITGRVPETIQVRETVQVEVDSTVLHLNEIDQDDDLMVARPRSSLGLPIAREDERMEGEEAKSVFTFVNIDPKDQTAELPFTATTELSRQSSPELELIEPPMLQPTSPPPLEVIPLAMEEDRPKLSSMEAIQAKFLEEQERTRLQQEQQKRELETEKGGSDHESELGKYDRDNMSKNIGELFKQKSKAESMNAQLQNILSQHFKTKKTEETKDYERTVGDQEQRYETTLLALDELREEYGKINNAHSRVINELSVRLDKRQKRAHKMNEAFVSYKRKVAASAENSRTGKAIPPKLIDQLESNIERKDTEVMAVRLEYIKLRNKLRRHEQMLRQKEELAEGLHLIDFEQLKIENQNYNEKIEERNEELLKLRKKITNTVQVLTHVKEKLQFVQQENSELKTQVTHVEGQVTERRDVLARAKQERDSLRTDNQKLRQKSGLLGNELLLRDFEFRKDNGDVLGVRLEELKKRHAELEKSASVLKRKLQKAQLQQ